MPLPPFLDAIDEQVLVCDLLNLTQPDLAAEMQEIQVGAPGLNLDAILDVLGTFT